MAEAFLHGGGGGALKSVIIATAPTGSTLTCSNGTVNKTAREKDGKWTFKNLDLGAWTVTATLDDQTAVKTVTLEQLTVVYLTLAYRSVPEFTYTGDYEIVQDDDTPIEDVSSYSGDWKIRFLTSGDLTVTDLHGATDGVDLFLVGGGGSGNKSQNDTGAWSTGAGGGGGYTKTVNGLELAVETPYSIVIGAGGSVSDSGADGGSSTAFDYSANGGEGGSGWRGGNGGSGGGGAGGVSAAGGSDGGNGGGNAPGIGQGTTTREFGEASGTLYAGGGGGGGDSSGDGGGAGGAGGGGSASVAGTVNTGGGGGGTLNGYESWQWKGGAGGSGIVIIRNAR